MIKMNSPNSGGAGRARPVTATRKIRANLLRAKRVARPGFFETLGTFYYVEASLRNLLRNDYTEKLHMPGTKMVR